MAEITAAMVKELRERTQAGMMDCKKALQESGGDMAAAAEILAKKGLTKAANKAGKVAAEGLVHALLSADGRDGVLVEVNCQTDFVAKGDDFKGLLAKAANAALAHRTADAAALNAVVVDGKALQEHADELTARSGEKHAIRRVVHYAAPGTNLLKTYIHHGSRIAVMVEVASSSVGDARVQEFADDIALQVASMSPLYLQKSDVPGDTLSKQREILGALMDKEDAEALAAPEQFVEVIRGKLVEWAREEEREVGDLDAAFNEHMARSEKDAATLDGMRKVAEKVRARPAVQREKILDGKVAKWANEVTLTEQVSVKESKKTIGQLQSELAKAVAGTAVVRFARFEVGEGIEKAPTKDFATEVAEMAAAANKA
jgi:elongation factor Ts